MQDSVRIMGIDVDMISKDTFIRKMNDYLIDEHLNIILFASTKMLDRAVEDEDYRSQLEMADLFLPGEEALLTAYHVDVLEAGDMVVNCYSFGLMLENLQQDRTLYIVADTRESVEKLQDYCQAMQPELRLVGAYSHEDDLEDAAVVNEINSHTPDMILLDLPAGYQEEWLAGHAALLHARLCIAVGGVAGLILATRRKTPGWVKKLRLERIYHLIFREQAVKKDVRARIFHRKVAKYNRNRSAT